jgi:thiol-disulfide isomerase/thioredoxin
MLSSLNRHSYLIVSAVAMGVAWLLGARAGGVWAIAGVVSVGAALALIQRKLRGGSSAVETWDEVRAATGHGSPLLLFIYSDTCGACLSVQPRMRGLERDLRGRADVLRLNVAEEVGRRARAQFGTTLVPALILLDGRGNELHRSEGRPPQRAQIFAALDSRRDGYRRDR